MTWHARQRQRAVEYITEPKAIKGSTRLEAKKQRRRDGRDAGRRRPVVTEAEFLARRESVDRKMVVRSKNSRTQIGVLEDGVAALDRILQSLPHDENLLTKRVVRMAIQSNFRGNLTASGANSSR